MLTPDAYCCLTSPLAREQFASCDRGDNGRVSESAGVAPAQPAETSPMKRALALTALVALFAVAPMHRSGAQVADTTKKVLTKKEKKQERREAKAEAKEAHPHIALAIKELEATKKELQTAAHDFGGHRADALKAVDEAIRQLRLAQQFDKK
jgi:hypothetical protein